MHEKEGTNGLIYWVDVNFEVKAIEEMEKLGEKPLLGKRKGENDLEEEKETKRISN